MSIGVILQTPVISCPRLPPPQVPALSGPLPAFIHDVSVDLLGGHDREGHRGGEGGASEGDGEDHGSAGGHLLAQLGGVQPAAAGPQRRAPRSHPEGDMIYY